MGAGLGGHVRQRRRKRKALDVYVHEIVDCADWPDKGLAQYLIIRLLLDYIREPKLTAAYESFKERRENHGL